MKEKVMTGRGRPMKYSDLIRALEMEKTYSAITVVENALEQGLLTKREYWEKRDTLDDVKSKVRMAMNRLAAQHLPKKEDELFVALGVPPQQAWYGWRWKDAIAAYYFEEHEIRAIEKAKQAFLHKREEEALALKKPAWWGKLLPRKARVSLAVILGIGLLAVGFMFALYPEGTRVFRESGPKAALDYFNSTETFYRRDPVAAFGKAWTKYTIGDFAGAEQDCHQLIRSKRTPEVTRGNCYFLLAKIKTRTGFYKNAHDWFGKALDIFERLDRPANLFRAYCALAVLAMESGELSQAEMFIQEAMVVNERAGVNPGEIYHLQADLAFHEKDYQRGLEISYRYYEAYKEVNHLDEVSNALVAIGFYSILTGQLEAGFLKTVEAQVLINQSGDQNKLYYTFINLLMLRRCEGKSYSTLEASIVKQIDEKQDQRLQELLSFAQDSPCGIGPEQTGEESQDPPPNVD